ncbi:MAG TPA: transglycosylase SLT domain-containing protein [Vicinamibacterales bacterium]|nr:transglycosylase SLT domain-containing protein [Vicinamibacterales bacterium]
MKRLLRIAIAFMLVALVSAVVPPRASAQASSEKYDAMFRKYTKRFFGPGFDWRLFKAQGMAESNLNPQARSGVGARGIMQLMSSTYKEVRSRNPDLGKIDDPEWNIAAGISYNRQLWRQWQPESDVRHLYEFMFGSYNAGRSILLRAQRVARDRALDDRLWPSIETVASSVPRWRYTETLAYVERIKANLEGMDDKGRVNPRR